MTLHSNEGSYLAHTQGKKHQNNLAQRAAKDAKDGDVAPAALLARRSTAVKKIVKIGRPGFRATKVRVSGGAHRNEARAVADGTRLTSRGGVHR